MSKFYSVLDFFEKVFQVPVPKYFAWSENDAEGTGYQTSDTWEKETSGKMPIRFYLGYTLPRMIYFTLSRFWRDTFTKYYNLFFVKDHLIDLRTDKELAPNDPDYYDWGYMDVDNMLFLAIRHCVKRYNQAPKFHPTEEDIQKEIEEYGEDAGKVLRGQKEFMDEFLVIHNYFMKERKEFNFDEGSYLENQNKFLQQEEEMLIRLIKIRKNLW